ncbi:hypothetical protein CHS0354_042422 [Potamilus streckersoni]|uniref:Uncharacterized protein n=1 Tax=Potamilus streckersoni TaxID=2493646 RepID=A0AAE0W1J8_9BIVA|nr:hypothetical protein CHS0354_042422 [Potamilus streckersoni]
MCLTTGRKRDVPSATVLNNIQKINEFGKVPEEQSDDFMCSECCDTELCNIKGCWEEGEYSLTLLKKECILYT